jgi:hypothetical protein
MNRDPAPHHPLVQRLIDARQVTDALFAIVKPEFLYERPIRERHRIVFYIGHLEAFDRNLFDQRVCELPAFSPELDQLFAFGIDPVDGGFPTDQPGDWPSLDTIREYGSRARAQIDQALAGLADAAQFRRDGAQAGGSGQLLNVAIEHRLMHAETLAYMLHQLPLAQKVTELREDVVTRPGRRQALSSTVGVPAGATTLGMSRDGGHFGWDNEFEEVRIDVPAFEIDRYMVTNGAFCEFSRPAAIVSRSGGRKRTGRGKWPSISRIRLAGRGATQRQAARQIRITHGCCARCSTKCRCRSTGPHT